MKLTTIYKLLALLVVATIAFSCVEDDDFDTPDTTVAIPQIDGTVISVVELRNLLLQEQNNNGNDVLTFSETNQYVSGFVISSDESGNWFEEMVIQDKASNPEAGVKLLVEVSPLFTSYEFGRKIFIKLDGLTVGLDSGVLSLGIADGSSLEKVASSQLTNFVTRDTMVSTITPLPVGLLDFSDNITNLYVTVENVQFSAGEVVTSQLTFAGEPTDEFDGERTIQDCATGLSAVFSTSTFADFKALLLPSGQGNINGILSKNFFGDQFNVVVNDPSGLVFENDRCDVCGLAEDKFNGVVFADDFGTQLNGDPISGNGWTNFAEEGTVLWETFTDNNSAFGLAASVGAFGSDDASSVSWLISPEINFDEQDGETLNFDTSNSFADQSYLLLLYSTDWDGNTANVSTANWLPILDATIVDDETFFGDWVPSGNVDLSCLSGTAHIAFKYVGNDVDDEFNGTFELDNVAINADVESTNTGVTVAVPYGEDFDAYSDFGGLITEGWSNQNVNGGPTVWVLGDFQNNKYAQISGFNSGENPIETWMVTPGVDMDNTVNETMTMDIQSNFDNGEILAIFYSTDFTGDASTATWNALSVNIPTGPASGFGTFENVGNVDVSFLTGVVHFGFRYQGGDPNATTRYHVDNFAVNGN